MILTGCFIRFNPRSTFLAMAQQTRLKDIAETAGCSIAVVSCVVNGAKGNISCNPELRERILRIAAELHYTPHFASKALRSNRTNTLGVCLPQNLSSADGLPQILAGMWDACLERKYDMLCLGADAQGCALALAERRVDAAVLPFAPDRNEWFDPFRREDFCCVSAVPVGDVPIDSVVADDGAASVLAVRALADAGHGRIGYLDAFHTQETSSFTLRRIGFEAEMSGRNLVSDVDWIFRAKIPGSNDWIESVADRFAKAPAAERPTAFVVQTAAMAGRFFRELGLRGIECPRDVSLVCVGDAGESALLSPPLSTVCIPYREIGAAAARRAIDRFEAVLDRGVPAHVSLGPLPTARLQQGHRGRRPTAVVNAIAEESVRRVQTMPQADAPKAEPLRKTIDPSFIDRGSILTLSK